MDLLSCLCLDGDYCICLTRVQTPLWLLSIGQILIITGGGGGVRMDDGRIQDRIITFIIVSTLLEREEK